LEDELVSGIMWSGSRLRGSFEEVAADRAVWYRLVGLFAFGTALCRAER
jgi:hypothetical protein